MSQAKLTSDGPSADAYFPPPEARGGWRSLVPPNQAPSAVQKESVLARTGLDWDRLREVWEYCQGFGGQHKVRASSSTTRPGATCRQSGQRPSPRARRSPCAIC
jgi:hypothetical protein